MVKKNVRSGHKCAQSLPLSTRLTARPIWDKTKKLTCEICQISCVKSIGFHMKSAGFHEIRNERPLARDGKAYVSVCESVWAFGVVRIVLVWISLALNPWSITMIPLRK